jgi:hypothetical protein
MPSDWARRHRVVPPIPGPVSGVTYRCVRCEREAVGAYPSGECEGDQRWRRRIRSGSKDAINERTWGLNLECGHLVFRPSEYSLPPDLMTDCEVCAADG